MLSILKLALDLVSEIEKKERNLVILWKISDIVPLRNKKEKIKNDWGGREKKCWSRN